VAEGEAMEGLVEEGPSVGGCVVGDGLGEGEEVARDGGGWDFWWWDG